MSAFESAIDIEGLVSNGQFQKKDPEKLNPSDYQNITADSKPWKLLKAKHCDYTKIVADKKKEAYLYEGGFQMNDPDIASLFCVQMKTEEDRKVFEERVKSAAYIPTFPKLITGLIANLFSEDLAVMEAVDHDDKNTAGAEFTPVLRDFYKLFESDCDGFGTSLHDFIRCQATKALTHQFSFFGVDYPKGDAKNLLEQEEKGLDKPQLYKIDFESVFDWKLNKDAKHEFDWLKLVCCINDQSNPFEIPRHKYQIKYWFINEEGLAAWELYETPSVINDSELKEKQQIPLIDSGDTTFKRIPVFQFYLEEGVAVGKKLAPLAAEHFNRTTIENHSTNRACLTIPVIYRGEMMGSDGSLPNPMAADMQRGKHPRGSVNTKGIVELGSYTEDRLEIVEAKGGALAFIHKQNEDLDEKMHSVVHQMAQSLKQSHSQSGKTAASKQEDRRSTEMLLTAIADSIFDVVKRLFITIAESRNDDIVWEVRGLCSLQSEERSDLVLEAQLLPILNFPSLTQQKEHYYRVGSRLIEGCGEEVLRTIRMELEENLDMRWDNGELAKAQGLPDPNQIDPMTGQPMQPVNGAVPMSGGKPAMPKTASQNPKINASGGSDLKPRLPSLDPKNQLQNKVKSAIVQNPHGKLKDPKQQPEQRQMGPAGQALLPDDSHLQTGQHIDGQVVFDQLKEDYDEKDIEFVKHIPWMGPVEVPLTSIDFSNKDNWQASQELDKVSEFADKMSSDSFNKPIILVNNPSNDNKMMVVDGHHRALAALQNNQPVNSYVGQVGSNKGPWEKLHGKQVGSKQASQQKQISQQVSKSEKDK